MKLPKTRRYFEQRLKGLALLDTQKKFNVAAFTVFALVIGGAGLFIVFSKASPIAPTVYLSPATITVGPSGTFSIQVRENSGTTGVNAVQANFSYPSNLVSCNNIDVSSSAFGVQAQSTCGGGQVTLARGTVGGAAPLTGDQLIAIVTFAANTTSGNAIMSFTNGTALVSASTNQDILGSLSATVGGTYTIDATAPTISITAPANNASLAYGNDVSITALATDSQSSISKVDIYIDGTLKTTLTTSPYTYAWSGATIGTHTIQANATDAFNNVGSSSMITVTVADQTPPSVSMTTPAAGSSVGGSSVGLSANASDNVGVASVQFKVDGANVGSVLTTSPYTITWDTTTTTNGGHSLTAVAKDRVGNAATSVPVSIIVDNIAPTVSIASPSQGTSLSGTATITVTAADNIGGSGIAKVELYVDGALTGTATTVPYTFSWDTLAASFGSHTLTVKAYDKTTPANSVTSSGVTVTVNNTIPGDINGDGRVDILDLSIMLSNYGTANTACDLNHDGIVNVLDLSILLSHFGQ